MQIYFHSHLCSYLSRVPILVEGTVTSSSNPSRKHAPRAASCQLIQLEISRNSSTYLSNLKPPCRNPHSASSAEVISSLRRVFCHGVHRGARNEEAWIFLWNTLFATQNRDRGRQEHTLMTLRLDTEAGKHRAYKGTNE